MISRVESNFWCTTHKFGIELPGNVKDTYETDKKMRTNFWGQVVEKEMMTKPCRNLMDHRRMLRRNKSVTKRTVAT
jgi:hypothetical protein